MRRTGTRLSRVRSRRDTQQAVVLLLLTIAIILAMITWGVPWMAKTAGMLITEDTGVGGTSELRPTPPIFSDVPEATSSSTVSVAGFAQPGVEVVMYLNGEEQKKVLTDDAGVFEFGNIALTEGENTVYAFATTPRGQESEQSREYVITMDNSKPEITLSQPEDGEVFRGQTERIATFQGLINESGSHVYVGERVAIVQTDGSFSVPYQLQDGEQEIVVRAVDRAGNETTKGVKLKWEQ